MPLKTLYSPENNYSFKDSTLPVWQSSEKRHDSSGKNKRGNKILKWVASNEKMELGVFEKSNLPETWPKMKFRRRLKKREGKENNISEVKLKVNQIIKLLRALKKFKMKCEPLWSAFSAGTIASLKASRDRGNRSEMNEQTCSRKSIGLSYKGEGLAVSRKHSFRSCLQF